MPRLVRLTLVIGATACAAVAIVPPVATADVARLEPSGTTDPWGLPSAYRVVVTDRRGAQRSLGPVPPGQLVAAPGRQHLLVVPDEPDDARAAPWLVPLDGSEVRQLQLPAGTAVDGGLSQVSWTSDGTELLVGDAIGWDPSAFAGLSDVDDPDRLRWTSLRCPIATGICTELGRSGGFAVGVPGGVLTTNSTLSSLPASWLFEENSDRLPEWERPTSPRGRTWIGIADDVRVASTQLIGPTTTTLGQVRRTATAGIPVATSAVGGPAGAVIARITVDATLERRRGRVRLTTRFRSPRLLVARPGAALRAFQSRPIPLARRERRRVSAVTASLRQRLHFWPRFATADGWIGGGGAASLAPELAVLATMDRHGRVRPMTVGRRPATGWNLLQAARVPSPGRVAGPVGIIGYEAAGNAIVSVGYRFGGTEMPGLPQRFATLRVPLNGAARPTVIRGTVDVAW